MKVQEGLMAVQEESI